MLAVLREVCQGLAAEAALRLRQRSRARRSAAKR
jgi:hypothetical protein